MLFVLCVLLFSCVSATGYNGQSFRRRVVQTTQLNHCIKMCGSPNTSRPTYNSCVHECEKKFP